MVGNTRRMMLASTILFHPIVVNSAFKTINCTAHPVSGALVLASSPGTTCFEGDHWAVFILAIIAIALQVIILPIFIVAVLGKSAGWCPRCGSASALQRRRASLEGAGGAPSNYGRVHGGLCCRSVCCVNELGRNRRNFMHLHDKDLFRVRNLSYAPFV
jgi:hypothetical protein